jgi:hypothetical protein
MSQINLQDLLASLQETNAEDIARAADPKAGVSGAWDIDLPVENEYRVEIVNATYGPSKNSGSPQATLTFQVLEPAEFEGAKFQGYYPLPPNNEASVRKFAELVGALHADGSSFGDDYEGFVQSWIDTVVVVATNRWGSENDRIGLRWVNANVGQSLRTDLKAPKPRKPAADIRPEINIPKDEPVETVAPPVIVDVAEEPVVVPASSGRTVTLPGGVNLPPGLRG